MTMSDHDDEDSNSSHVHVAQRMQAILHPRTMAGGESAEDEPGEEEMEEVLPPPRAGAPPDHLGSDDDSDADLDSILNAAAVAVAAMAGDNMTMTGTNTTTGITTTGGNMPTAAAAATGITKMMIQAVNLQAGTKFCLTHYLYTPALLVIRSEKPFFTSLFQSHSCSHTACCHRTRSDGYIVPSLINDISISRKSYLIQRPIAVKQ
jgi:hypothetical protein